MKKRSEVGSRAIRKRIAKQFAKQTARVVKTQGARTVGRGSRPIGTGACIDSGNSLASCFAVCLANCRAPVGSTHSVFVSIGGRSSLFMNNPG